MMYEDKKIKKHFRQSFVHSKRETPSEVRALFIVDSGYYSG